MYNRPIFDIKKPTDNLSDMCEEYVFVPNVIKESNKAINEVKKKLHDAQYVENLYAKEIMELCIVKQCSSCKSRYKEKDNFKWACRFHPGKIDYEDEVYTCCNTTIRTDRFGFEFTSYVGCTKCDHRDVSADYTSTDDQYIPICLVNLGIIKLLPSKINVVDTFNNESDPLTSCYIVRRYEE